MRWLVQMRTVFGLQPRWDGHVRREAVEAAEKRRVAGRLALLAEATGEVCNPMPADVCRDSFPQRSAAFDVKVATTQLRRILTVENTRKLAQHGQVKGDAESLLVFRKRVARTMAIDSKAKHHPVLIDAMNALMDEYA